MPNGFEDFVSIYNKIQMEKNFKEKIAAVCSVVGWGEVGRSL
jgi:hypothetical protein